MSLYKVRGTDVDGFVNTPLFIVFWMRGECGKTGETSQEVVITETPALSGLSGSINLRRILVESFCNVPLTFQIR